MFNEVGYFWPDDDKLSSLRPSDMSDPSITLQRYTKKSQFFIFVYSMIENGVFIGDKFVGLTMKPTSKSISALLKLKPTKMNIYTSKSQEKEKNTFLSPPRRF
jgi:hypothetical protein